MKVIDLYKQLGILIRSGQENLPVMLNTSDNYKPLEVVDIIDGKCCFCDSWTPVFEDIEAKQEEE